MMFSASAVTAEQQYCYSYLFLVRQAAWLFIGLLGMFALMKTDYRRLREPAVVYPVVCVVLLLLVGTFFLDKSHATHRWIKVGPVGIQPRSEEHTSEFQSLTNLVCRLLLEK